MFKIRSPRISDFEKLEQLFKDKLCFKIVYEKPLHKLLCLAQPLIPYSLRLLPSMHIAVEGENILGYVVLRCVSKPNNCWQIDDVFVFDEVRNEGVGEELLRYVLSVYGGQGIEHFLAEVDSQNFPALSLFHQCGFRRYAKVYFYQKEINIETMQEASLLDKDFILRPQTMSDLGELEKLDLSSIPPDLRPTLGRSKDYFKEKKNALVLVDKSRNLIIGWATIQILRDESYFVELIASPGWTHLYEQFLNSIVFHYIPVQTNQIKLSIKVIDYLTELKEILIKLGYQSVEVKELLVRTIWQKVKERKKARAAATVPRAAPT